MARVYMITEEEMGQLLNDLLLETLIANNICNPHRRLDEGLPLDQAQKDKMKPIIDSLHRGFHMVVCRWADRVGFGGSDWWKRYRDVS